MNIFYWEHAQLASWLEVSLLKASEFYKHLDSGRIMDWKAIAASPHYQEMLQEIKEQGEYLADRPIPELTQELYLLYEQTGNRLTYEGIYFERRSRLTTFALLHIIYPQEPSYFKLLCEIITSIVQENTWCLPAHMQGQDIDRHIDLFAAETGFTLSEILTLAHLPKQLVDTVQWQINERLFVPYLHSEPYHWESADHNWAAVCAGSIASAALLIEQNNTRKAIICAKAIGTLNCYLSGFGSDGACLEGPGYWNYGFGYYVYFADLFKQATGHHADLLHNEKVKAIALFQQKSYLVHNRPANFSDAMSYVNVNIGLSDYLASYYEDIERPAVSIRTSFSEDHCARFAPALRNLLWYQGAADRKMNWQVGSWYLTNAQWLISRFTSPAGSFGFAAKGGSNDEPHNHNDVGHFILLADDDPAFIADLGGGEYTKDYFGDERYSYDCTGAQGHSLPIINGKLQATGAAASAVVLEVLTQADEDHFVLDLTKCYPESGLSLYKRTFHLVKIEHPVLTLTDEFHFNSPAHSITEAIVTRCKPQLVEKGRIVLQGQKHAAIIEYEAEQFEATVEQRYFANHFGEQESYYCIYLAVHSSIGNKFLTQLTIHFQAEGEGKSHGNSMGQ